MPYGDTDAPASAINPETTTAASKTALLKGIKNLILTISDKIPALSGGKVPVVESSAASILAKIIAAPATEAKQDSLDTLLRTTGITILPLSHTIDSIDVAKQSKGAVTVAHSAISATATSAELDCRGHNAILILVEFSGAYNWTFKLQGSMVSGGTFVDWYEQANTGSMVLMSYQCNANRGWTFKGIPDYVKIVATEDADGGTVTVKVQPVIL